MRAVRPAIAFLMLALAAPRLRAQVGPLVPPDNLEKTEVIRALIRELRAQYVFPETAEKMIAMLEGEIGSMASASPTDRPAFAQHLTAELQGIAHDKHLRVQYSPQPIPDSADVDAPDSAMFAQMRTNHFGFARAAILPGNVGLLDLRGFNAETPESRDTAIAAMKRLAGADALIVDLRRNGGGDPQMVALVSSMLWPRGKRVHLNNLYFRPTNYTFQFFTNPDLDVPRITGPVFTVTSSYTFSAAEEFTYNLKQLKRATQVGETTGGGANPGSRYRLSEHFAAFVPSGRAINPISRTNWEGVGNIPEIATSRDSALSRAYVEALNRLEAAATTDLKRAEIRAARAKIDQSLRPG